SVWRPLPQFAISLPVAPDATVYGVALLLSLASGLLFGAVPVRQVLRTNPHELIKSGARSTAGRRVGVRDVLLAVQIAICAVLGVASVGVVGQWPPLHLGWYDSDIFTDDATDLRASKAAAHAITYSVSPDYFRAAGTALLAGRAFTAHDDSGAPRVAVVNGR